jgi:hypothetical protein
VLTTKTVLELLEKNIRTLASLKGSLPAIAGAGVAPASILPDMATLVLPEAVEAAGDAVIDVKGIVEGVLDSIGFSNTRSSKMDVDDFLMLLDAMNKAGIHFAA